MTYYDDIVVGSGASGLSMALLLGKRGRKVLLVEKASKIGGSLRQFYKDGLFFDTGFHFTGGMNGGILSEMLKVLNIDKDIEPIFMLDKNNRFRFEKENFTFTHPNSIDKLSKALKIQFPKEKNNIDGYFNLMREVCEGSQSLKNFNILEGFGKYDFVSFKEVLDEKFTDDCLKTVLSAYCMCSGTTTKEISFANYCRIALPISESLCKFKNGGSAMISAFEKELAKNNVEIMTSTHILQFENIEGKEAHSLILSNNNKINFDKCFLAIHPFEILGLLPEKTKNKAFTSRVQDFNKTIGFFSVYASAELTGKEKDLEPEMVSVYSEANIDKLLTPNSADSAAVVMTKAVETLKNGGQKVVFNALNVSFYEDIEKWDNEKQKKRPSEYLEYKEKQTKIIVKYIKEEFKEYANTLNVVCSSSMLTFKDYINSPFGDAYGIKQQMGQFNLLGKLPLRNLYAIGQSSLLPGVAGAMMSTFVVLKNVVGVDTYLEILNS